MRLSIWIRQMALTPMLAATLLASADTEPPWRIAGIPAEARISDGPMSAARWIWTKAPAVRDQVVYFRFRFEAGGRRPGETKPFLVCRADDHLAGAYLNGHRLNVSAMEGRRFGISDFGDFLRNGENVLALAVSNGMASAAVIFHGACAGADGRPRVISSSEAVKCSASHVANWMSPCLDDSSWETSREIGDATTAPWNESEALVRACMTDEEWADYQRRLRRASSVMPPGLAAEPEPSARVVYRGWMPKLEINGRDLEPDISRTIHLGASVYPDSAALKLASLGFPITALKASGDKVWKGDGAYDFSSVDYQAGRLLTLAQNSYIEIALSIDRCVWWCAAHPEDTIGYATGPADAAEGAVFRRTVRPSVASDRFRRDVARLVAAFGEFARSRPWGRRVVAVRVCYGIYGEWHSFGMYEGPDTGAAMADKFRSWLRGKYGTDAVLAAAWNAPGATLASATPPAYEERISNPLILPLKKRCKALDFFECHAGVTADFLLDFAAAAKTAFPGRLVGAYYGYVFDLVPPEGATVMLDKVLSSPSIDYLVNPPTYTAEMRRAGGAFVPRFVPATFRRYGKLAVLEDDSRYHHVRELRGLRDAHVSISPEESRATVMRNYFNRMFDGVAYETLDPAPGNEYAFGSFDNPVVLSGLYDAMRISARAGDPGMDSCNDLAVVIDWRGRLRLHSRCNRIGRMHETYRHSQENLYRTGIPFDMLTLDDYLAGRDYPHVLFLNPEEADAGLMAKARAKAGGGAMFFDGAKLTAEDWSERLVAAGLHRWISPGSCIRRHGRFFMFHTGTIGPHRILLPAGCAGASSLVTGRAYNGNRMVLETKQPMTDLFELR